MNSIYKFLLVTAVAIFSSALLDAQPLTRAQIEAAAKTQLPNALFHLKDFLEIPNDGHYPEHVQNNIEYCVVFFKKQQFDVQVLETSDEPIVLAQRVYRKNAKTVLFYLQIDGQPVDIAAWDQENPYHPALKELDSHGQWQTLDYEILRAQWDPDWRIFARSASDSKGPAMAFMSALEILNKKNIRPRYNIKVIMDFQEELGSPALPAAVNAYKEKLAADMMLIMDGTRHLSNLPTLTYGARGIATATLKVFGPRYALHSGQYGNFAPNPVFAAARLIGSLKDESGRVTIPGFYAGIKLSEADKNVINNVPEDLSEIKKSLGIATHDQVGETYQEALQYPSLNIRGIQAAWVGEKKRTIIPEEVVVEIDMRLVPESDGERLMGLLKQHIVGRGFHLVDSIPTEEERAKYSKLASFNYSIGSKPYRTEFDTPIGKMLNQAMTRTFGDQVVNMRTTGGSQPIAPFISTLNIPAVSVRIPNPDNSIHAPNENIRLGNFLEGIQTCLGILTENLK